MKEDVEIWIVGNGRGWYFWGRIKRVKEDDEEKINSMIVFCWIRFWSCKRRRVGGEKRKVEEC